MMIDWLLRNARLADHASLVDIAVDGDHIAAIGPSLKMDVGRLWDLDGRVVLTGLVDVHTHLDKTYLPVQNGSGTLLEAIDLWRDVKVQRSRDDVRSAARRALARAVVNGVTAMRSHVDIEAAGDLSTLEALLEVRDEWRQAIDLQFVALGDVCASPESKETLTQALTMGADCVGGAPALTDDPRASIDGVFALAEQHGKPIDLHIDETEDPETRTLAYLAKCTVEHDMQGLVTAGHCCSLAFVDQTTAAHVMDKVAAAEINIITLPSCNLVLMGRGMQPTPRGVTRVKELLARGVTVCAASDNVSDPFNPFGDYDLLQIANLNAHVAHMSGEEELARSLQMVTALPAGVFGLEAGSVAAGSRADLVVLDTRRVLDAVLAPPLRLATFKSGRLIVRTDIGRQWYDAAPLAADSRGTA